MAPSADAIVNGRVGTISMVKPGAMTGGPDSGTMPAAPSRSEPEHATGYRVCFARMTFGEMLSLIKEDYIAHGRDWTKPGFRAVAAHRFGNWRMNIPWKPLRAPFSVLYHHLFRQNCYRGIEIDYSVQLGRRTRIEHQGAIVLHSNSIIGDECVIRQGVTLGIRSPDQPFEVPIVGNNVDIGAGAKLLGGIRVGDGAKIGANAVVLCDVPAGATAVGIPARILLPGRRD